VLFARTTGSKLPVAPSVVAPVVPGMSDLIVVYYDRASAVSEQYRQLRTGLLAQNPRGDHRVLAVTSSLPKEGKTITTANMAFCLAEVRHLRILIVDADFRGGSLAPMLGLPSKPGLADVLREEIALPDAVQTTPLPNLFFLPAGACGPRQTPAELLSAKLAATTFKRLSGMYHYTIVDTPAATTFTDVGVVGQLCDGVILVVRTEFAPEPAARQAVHVLRQDNVAIVGVVAIGDPSEGVAWTAGSLSAPPERARSASDGSGVHPVAGAPGS